MGISREMNADVGLQTELIKGNSISQFIILLLHVDCFCLDRKIQE